MEKGTVIIFQFHKGTIRTSCSAACQFPFQFHKGTIRTFLTKKPITLSVYFNSIKVRLELVVVAEVLREFRNFNSIKVRLEHDEKIRYYVIGE